MMLDYLQRHIEWSRKTFGEGRRTRGIIKHIRRELSEIKQEPLSLEEWIDVAILAFDGAWRAGHSAEQIINALQCKQEINLGREWPAPGSEDQPREHIRR